MPTAKPIRTPGPQGGAHAVAQMIVLFPDRAAAAAAAQRVTDQWRACTGRQVTETRSDGLTPPALDDRRRCADWRGDHDGPPA